MSQRKKLFIIYIILIGVGAATQPDEGFGFGSILNLVGWVGLVVLLVEWASSKLKKKH